MIYGYFQHLPIIHFQIFIFESGCFSISRHFECLLYIYGKKLAQFFGLVILFFPNISLYQSNLLVDEILNEGKRSEDVSHTFQFKDIVRFSPCVSFLFFYYQTKQQQLVLYKTHVSTFPFNSSIILLVLCPLLVCT